MSTLKSIIRKYGLLGQNLARKSFLNERHVGSRLNCYKAYSNVDPSLWNDIIFSDQCDCIYSEEKGNMSFDQKEPDSMTNICHQINEIRGAIWWYEKP